VIAFLDLEDSLGIEVVEMETVFFNVGYIGVGEMEIDLFAL